MKFSAERGFAVHLNREYDNRLPLNVASLDGNWADLLILVVHRCITTSNPKIEALTMCMLNTISNISPYMKSISVVAARRLIGMMEYFSSLRYIMTSEDHHDQINLILESVNNLIQYQYEGSHHLVYALLQRCHVFESFLNLQITESPIASTEQTESPEKHPLSIEDLKTLIENDNSHEKQLVCELLRMSEYKRSAVTEEIEGKEESKEQEIEDKIDEKVQSVEEEQSEEKEQTIEDENKIKEEEEEIKTEKIEEEKDNEKTESDKDDEKQESSVVNGDEKTKPVTKKEEKEEKEEEKPTLVTLPLNEEWLWENALEVLKSDSERVLHCWFELSKTTLSSDDVGILKALFVELPKNGVLNLFIASLLNTKIEESTQTSPASTNERTTTEQTHLQPSQPLPFSRTNAWLQSWKRTLPMSTIHCLLYHLMPKVKSLLSGSEMIDVDDSVVLNFLSEATLVGLLPQPHRIMVRKFTPSAFSALWIHQFQWALILTKNQMKFGLFDIAGVRLFNIRSRNAE
eukprot:TRINITY_DN48607_c0_g2_i2.p1 TRINITY_DN48607_c0_g2~~TRINITY_DN48607_c0_g2_i2.p1  ORF type:complete len:517 (-),score=189.01 TRINITY_DN48607_c0_g2_i2:219-1769(-)